MKFLTIILAILITSFVFTGIGCKPSQHKPVPPVGGNTPSEMSTKKTETGEADAGSTVEIEPAITVSLPDGWPEYAPLPPGSEIIKTDISLDGDPLVNFEVSSPSEDVYTWLVENLTGLEWVEQPSLHEGHTADGFRIFFTRNGEKLNIMGRHENGVTNTVMIFLASSRE